MFYNHVIINLKHKDSKILLKYLYLSSVFFRASMLIPIIYNSIELPKKAKGIVS